MHMSFEKKYAGTHYACRSCNLDCTACPYGADIVVLEKVDKLLIKKRLREQEIRRAKEAIAEIDKQIAALSIL